MSTGTIEREGLPIPGVPGLTVPARLLTTAEAAAVLSIPEGALAKRVAARAVPHTRIGKHVRFTPGHLGQIITAGEQPVVGGPNARGTARTKL